MRQTRRTLLWTLGAAGLALVAKPVFAAEEAPGKGWSGVYLHIVGDVANIRELDPLGPAARAGLRPGDLVTGCNGGGLDRLPAALSGAPGDQVELIIQRDRSRRTVRLVLEAYESARP